MKSLLIKTKIKTKLGSMLAVADDKKLYCLEFLDQKNLDQKIELIEKEFDCVAVEGKNAVTKNIAVELTDYFSGKNKIFKTPLDFLGTQFQKTVWHALQKIPFGKTRSYLEIAITIKKSTAFRAVANANGANALAIIVPCHRVINASGALGGYAGGIERKAWLLEHERKSGK